MVETFSAPQARRIALAAQGFGRQSAPAGTRQLNLLMQRLGVLQLDSVNVFERSHYLPAFARLGAYDKAALDRLTFTSRAPYVEYWAHQAALIPVESWPLWGWHQRQERDGVGRTKRWAEEHRPMIDFLLAELAEKGALPASAIEHESNKRNGPWWGWSEVKTGLEVLFFRGDVAVAGRTRFERLYDLPERRLPAEVIGRDIPKPDAIRELVQIGSRALGIGTVRDIADYWRLPQADTKAALADLVESGDLQPVTVRGWTAPAFLHRDSRIPRRIEAAALLSPFDPVVWERARALRMYGFHYRIEIYTPAPQRVYGYYTLPVLIDEALVGRIDLKTDRQNGVLRVQSAWREGQQADGLEPRIAQLLRDTAAWQGMAGIEVVARGDLADALAVELGVPLLPWSAAEEPAAEA
ncbi:winged helix-turn-helix domain-containing protein [soil metagenome]